VSSRFVITFPNAQNERAQKRRLTLSERNGDKSRFHRLRKKKAAQRERNRKLRETLVAPKPLAAKAQNT